MLYRRASSFGHVIRQIAPSRCAAAIASVAIVLATGCSNVISRFESAQTRITTAVPPSVKVTALTAAAAAAAEAVPGRRARIEREMAAFLQARVIECAKGVTVSWSDSTAELRAKLKDLACFGAKDQEMLAWLRRMHVGTHLLQPAEPVEGKPLISSMLLDQEIWGIRLPEHGAIAVASHPQGWTLINLHTGTKVRQGKDSGPLPSRRPALSKSGRVVLMVPAEGRLLLEETASGQLLEDLGADGVTYFNWVSDTMAMVYRANPRQSLLVDYKTGHQAELPAEGLDFYFGALPTPVAGEFLLTSLQSLRLVRIESTETALSIALLREIRLDTFAISHEASTLSSDGRNFLAVLGRLTLIDVANVTASTLDLGTAFDVMSARRHADPEKFFLTAAPAGRRPAGFVLDVQQLTVARLSEPGDGHAHQYWSAAKKYVTANGRSLRVVDSPPSTDAAEPLATFATRMQQAENERKLAAVDQPKPVQQSAPRSIAVPAGSRVVAVGAYESRAGSHGVGRPHVAGAIDVTVMRSKSPVVLVLTSYEPVNWRIQLAPGAALSAVLLFGYHESSVFGHGGVKLHRGGRLYAYQRPSKEFELLNREVMQLTGVEINGFQGAYSATSFSVASW